MSLGWLVGKVGRSWVLYRYHTMSYLEPACLPVFKYGLDLNENGIGNWKLETGEWSGEA